MLRSNFLLQRLIAPCLFFALAVFVLSVAGAPFDLVGQWPNFTRGQATTVVVRGSYAYVGAPGLQIVDITDPASPQRVGGLDLQGEFYGLTLSGDRLVIANGGSGLAVVDISSPTAPRLLGTTSDAYANFVAVDGSFAYVADEGGALKVFDMSDPARLRQVGSYTATRPVVGVTIAGHYAYIATYQNPVEVLDITDPTHPQRVGSIRVPGEPWRIAVDGKYGFVTGFNTGLQIIDVTNPAAPTLVSHVAFNGWSRGVIVDGARVQVVNWGNPSFQSFDISDPLHPRLLGKYSSPGTEIGMASVGPLTYLAGDMGLDIIDSTDPAHPQLVGNLDLNGSTSALAVSGTYVYLADGNAGMQVIDISVPANPRRVSRYPAGANQVSGIAVTNQVAYLAVGDSGVDLVDVSDPFHPRRVGRFTGAAYNVALLGQYLCVLNQGLQLIDVSNPAQPKSLSRYSPHGNAASFAVSENKVFVSSADQGWEIIDWSNPVQPVKIASVKTGLIAGIAARGERLYLLIDGILRTWDVSEPARPVPLGSFTGQGYLGQLSIFGDYAWVVESGWEGIWIDLVVLDVATPARPLPISRIAQTQRPVYPVASVTQGAFLFAAEAATGLTVRSLPGPLTMLHPPQPERPIFGDPTELTALTFGASPVQYQWYYGAGGDTSSPVPGATGAILSLPPVWDPSSYWVRIRNQSGQVDSQAVDVRPAQPLQSEQVSRSSLLNPPVRDIALGDHFASILDSDALRVLDVSNPAQPTPVSRLPLATNADGLAIADADTYLWNSSGTLDRVNLTDPAHPLRAGSYSTHGAPIYRVAFPEPSTNLAEHVLPKTRGYLAAGVEGVVALDLGDPAALRPLGSYVFADEVTDVAAAGQYVLVIVGGAVQIVDFKDPANPKIAASYFEKRVVCQAVNRVLVSGQYALLAIDACRFAQLIPRLEILDISDPAHPQLVGTLAGVSGLRGVDGTRAYLSNPNAGFLIQVVDFSDPATPALIGRFDRATAVLALAAHGNSLWVADGDNGLLTVQWSPQLRVGLPSLSASTSTLRWTGAAGVTLQQSHALTNAAWQDLAETDGRSRIDLPRVSQPAFFRAVKH